MPRAPARALLVALRPRQWTKNGFVFAALILTARPAGPRFTGQVIATLVAFVLFCAASSAVYLLNDLADVEQDRQHPVKRHRPIAAGELSPSLARLTAAGLAIFAVLGAVALGPLEVVVIVAYLTLQLSYTYRLKHIVIVDVLAIAGGFVLRVLAGGAAIDRPISPYLYLSMIFLALFQGFSKRRHELISLAGGAGAHRASLGEYNRHLLDHFIMIAATSSIVTYCLYAITSPDRPPGVSANMLLLTVPFVLYAVFRYLYLIHTAGQGGTPEDMLLSDRPLLLAVVGWVVSLLAILYALPAILTALSRLIG